MGVGSGWELAVGSWELEVIYPRSQAGRAKSVIDIYHRHAARAGVEHPQQGGNPAVAGAVPDAGRDRDHRNVDQPADHTWQRTFHAGDDDQDSRATQPFVFTEQTMQAGNADVIEPIDGVTHDLRSDGSFFSDRKI